MKSAKYAALALLVPGLAWGQSYPNPVLKLDSSTVTATGGTAARTLAARAAERLNVRDFGAVGDGTTDDSAALATCINRAITLWLSGTLSTIYIPTGTYLIKGTQLPKFLRTPGSIIGDGSLKSVIKIDPTYAGDVFSWDEAWIGTSFPYNGNSITLSAQNSGPAVRGITVTGDRSASAQQNAFVFYDRNDNVVMDDVQVLYLKGRAFYSGVLSVSTEAQMRESHFSNLKFWNDGATGVPVMEFNSQGVNQATNEININVVDIYANYGPGIVVRNNSTVPSSTFRFSNIRVEGLESNPAGIAADLVTIGDGTQTGVVHDVFFHNLALLDPYSGYASLRTTAPSLAAKPYNIRVSNGVIGGGTAVGKGLSIDAGSSLSFQFSDIGTSGTNVTVGASTLTAGPIFLDGGGKETAWTYSVDATANAYFRTPNSRSGVPTGQSTATYTSAQAPDGTLNFGDPRGANSTDWQTLRFGSNQAATASFSTISGGQNNRASQNGATVGGGSTNTNAGLVATIAGGSTITLTGQYSAAPGGLQTTDRGVQGKLVWGSGQFAVQGDAQSGVHVLRGTGSGTTAFRLTADQAAAASTNCVNIPNNTAYSLVITLLAFDHTNPAKSFSATWGGGSIASHILSRGASASTTLIDGVATAITPDATRSNGTLTGIGATLAADTSLGCVNPLFTPPTSNTDTWNVVARVETVEVQ